MTTLMRNSDQPTFERIYDFVIEKTELMSEEDEQPENATDSSNDEDSSSVCSENSDTLPRICKISAERSTLNEEN